MFKVGDRVRRRNLVGEGHGTGTLLRLRFGQTWIVSCDDTKCESQWTEEFFEPAPAGPAPAQPAFEKGTHWTQTAVPLTICIDCSKTAEELGKMKAERDALQLAVGNHERAGDIAASRDQLRARCHELETALAFAEREVARLSKRGGR